MSQGEDVFIKKLIPHIYMSKDEFPKTMTPNDVLERMYKFMEDWKSKLYDMISFHSNTSSQPPGPQKTHSPIVNIKQEPCDPVQQQYLTVPPPPHHQQYSPPVNRFDHRGYLHHQMRPQLSPVPLSLPPLPQQHHQQFLNDSLASVSTRPFITKSPPSEEGSSSSRSLSPKHPRAKRNRSLEKSTEENIMKSSLLDIATAGNKKSSGSGFTDSYLKKFGVKDVVSTKKTTYYEYDHNKDTSKMKMSEEEKQVIKDQQSILNQVNEIIKSTDYHQAQDTQRKALKKESILSQVNEIIKSCVKLKENKSVSAESHDKANIIIQKAKEKKEKLLKEKMRLERELAGHCKNIDKLEDGEIGSEENESQQRSRQEEIQRSVQIIKKTQVRRSRSGSMDQERSNTKSSSRSKPRSLSRSWSRGRSLSRFSRESKTTRYPRRRSRSRSRSLTRRYRSVSRGRSRSRRRSESSDSRERRHYRRAHYMVSRSRSRSRGRCSIQKKKTWIAVCPCIITDDVTLEENSKMKVTVVQKEQYFFRSNAEFMVKITKWTGQDHVSGVHVTPQTVTLTDKRDIEVTVENPYDDRVLKLEHNDKVACLSILSCPVPRFSNSLAPDRYQTSTEKWFKMTTALLHKKGSVARDIIIHGTASTIRCILLMFIFYTHYICFLSESSLNVHYKWFSSLV